MARATAEPESAPEADGTPVGELTYTEASAELDEIVAFFDGEDVDVDQLVVKLQRATAIVDELDRRLRRTRMQVEELVPRLEAVSAADRSDTGNGDDGDDDAGDEPPLRVSDDGELLF